MRILFGWMLWLALSGGVAAQDVTAPDVLVKNSTQEVLGILKLDKDNSTGSRKGNLALVEAKVAPHFDFTHMTMLATGRPWRDANSSQQQALVREFQILLVRTYSRALEMYKTQTVEVRPLTVQAGELEVTVKTLISQPGGAPISMDYRMERTAQGWKVFDVTVDAVSIVTNYRSQFAGEVGRSGIDGLIKSLAEKNANNAKS